MTWFQRIALLGCTLTLLVIVLGAYVRLSDAGLGCPDWPGCYGKLDVPNDAAQIAKANAEYPHRPVETGKAWKEMIHRYVAGALGILVVVLAAAAWRRRHAPNQQLLLPVALVGLVIFQALLGKWTVTWQLKPLVVTAHLLGGMTTFSLLVWIALRSSKQSASGGDLVPRGLRLAALFGLVLVAAQIALGGWTSSNYAALACTQFPTCQNSWWPSSDFANGFTLWRGLGVNYEFGILDHPARVAIHLTHRLGALIILLYIGALAIASMMRSERRLKNTGKVIGALLVLQVGLGIANVVYSLPLAVAVGHNMTAALLLAALLTLIHFLLPRPLGKADEHPDPAVRSASALA